MSRLQISNIRGRKTTCTSNCVQKAREIVLGKCFLGHLGDSLCVTPLPRLLTTLFQLEVYVGGGGSMAAVFENNPYVAGFRSGGGIPLDTRIAGHGHLIHRLQRRFGAVFLGEPRSEVYLNADERQWAAQQRSSWPTDRPVCLFSTRAIADGRHYSGCDWKSIGDALQRHFVMVQPMMTTCNAYACQVAPLRAMNRLAWPKEPPFSQAIHYNDLNVRKYIALFSVVDCYCGTLSGGSHVAAAFRVPSLVVIWNRLRGRLEFPTSSLCGPDIFLYPQHHHITPEELAASDHSLAAFIRSVVARGRAPMISNASPKDQPCTGQSPRSPFRGQSIASTTHPDT